MPYTIINADCFEWMKQREENSITAIVTDPPYGVKEYTEGELKKQRQGQGGIWRIPPSFDGHVRQAVPRFSVINDDPKERENVYSFSLSGQFWLFALLFQEDMFLLHQLRCFRTF